MTEPPSVSGTLHVRTNVSLTSKATERTGALGTVRGTLNATAVLLVNSAAFAVVTVTTLTSYEIPFSSNGPPLNPKPLSGDSRVTVAECTVLSVTLK